MAVQIISKPEHNKAHRTTCNCGCVLSYMGADAQTLPERPGDGPAWYVQCPGCRAYVFVGATQPA